MNRKEFIEYIAKMVVATPSEFFNSITIAQAALESGWGNSTLYKAFNNSFGYKAKPGEWSGKIAGDYKSNEEVDGVLIKDVPSDFRAYDSVLDSVRDHAYMMSRKGTNTVTGKPYDYSTTYRKAIDAKTPEEQAKWLTGVYAGDSKYDVKLMEIIDAYGLKKYDGIKEDAKDNTGGDKVMATLRKPIQKITLVNKFARHTNKPKYIVIHYIGAAGQALANANYFYNINRNASAHYFIDKNVTYQVVEDDAGAWHVG